MTLGNECGENEKWVGCGDPCKDLTPCEMHKCPALQQSMGMCVCKDGYRLSYGECVPEHQCPFAKADWSDWSPWSDCSKTCGKEISIFEI